jgi:integrase
VEVRRNLVDRKITTPKNGSGRRIDVSRQLADTLKALVVDRKKETLRKGWREMPSWVFINEVGNVVDPDNFFRNRVALYLILIGVLGLFPHLRLH